MGQALKMGLLEDLKEEGKRRGEEGREKDREGGLDDPPFSSSAAGALLQDSRDDQPRRFYTLELQATWVTNQLRGKSFNRLQTGDMTVRGELDLFVLQTAMSSSPSQSSISIPPSPSPTPAPPPYPLWLAPNPPPPAVIPPFETEQQLHSHRFALRLALSFLAINVLNCFVAGFDIGWELPRWTAGFSAFAYGPFFISRFRRMERAARRKIQESEERDAELGAVVDPEEKVAGFE